MPETTKRRPGRPTTIDAKRVCVTLDARSVERARAIGEGNVSKGIREALKAYDHTR